MDSRVKNRARLWLRSERAFGLRAVPGVFPEAPVRVQQKAPEPIAPPPQAARPPVPARPAANAPMPRAVAAFFKTAQPAAPEPEPSLLPPAPDTGPFTAPELPVAEKKSRLLALNDNEVRGCTKCRLCEKRTQTVFGEGDPGAQIFFIGEGPGETEDQTGRPFVGRAGELLNKWIAAMGLAREQVYIANVVKCRPPGNREPAPDEVATCTPYLQRQLEIIRPKVIITLGRPAMQYMLQTKTTMSRMRGQWQQWRGIKLLPTYHPAYVLRSYTYETRSAVWNDLKMVMAELGLSEPKKTS